jgi:hypothetical protein
MTSSSIKGLHTRVPNTECEHTFSSYLGCVGVKLRGLPYVGHYGFPMNATLVGGGGLENPQGHWFLLSNTWPG